MLLWWLAVIVPGLIWAFFVVCVVVEPTMRGAWPIAIIYLPLACAPCVMLTAIRWIATGRRNLSAHW